MPVVTIPKGVDVALNCQLPVIFNDELLPPLAPPPLPPPQATVNSSKDIEIRLVLWPDIDCMTPSRTHGNVFDEPPSSAENSS